MANVQQSNGLSTMEQAAILFALTANKHLEGTGICLALGEDGCMRVIHTASTTDEEALELANLALQLVYYRIH